MGSGDAGGVLISPAPASMGPLTTAVGRLLEPEIIALSSHGGHHLFINRIPPRLPKEDVEKIILAQLRLHPFVLQVSKCSVIPQNSLKNKGYGFITLDGSPSPSDLDVIADSLNNKLQVGCRTLGVRVCTDCHSACYGDDDGYASSSSRSSTLPNEPDSFDLPDTHITVAIESQLNTHNGHESAASGKGDGTGHEQGPSPAPLTSALAAQPDVLHNAFTSSTKQNISSGSGSATMAGPRRRKAARPYDLRLYADYGRYHNLSQNPSPQMQNLSYGGHEGHRWRGQKGIYSGHAAAHTTGRNRRSTADANPSLMSSKDLSFRVANAVQQTRDGDTLNQQQTLPGPCDRLSPQLPPQAAAFQHQQPVQTLQQLQQKNRESAIRQKQQQEQEQQGVAVAAAVGYLSGDCVVNTVVMSSPRSISSYSSASGSGPGSASNSAPGSVMGSGDRFGSGRISGSSVAGWCAGEDSPDRKTTTPLGTGNQPFLGRCNVVDAEVNTDADGVAALQLPVGTSNQAATWQQQQHQVQGPTEQQPSLEVLARGDASSTAFATKSLNAAREQLYLASGVVSPPQQQQAGQQPFTTKLPFHVFQRRHLQQSYQLVTQPSGSMARRARSPSHGSRTVTTLAVAEPVSSGLQGHAGMGHQTIGQAVTAPSAALSQLLSPAQDSYRPAGANPTGPTHLHSASAPTSSWYMHQCHRQQQDRHRSTFHRQVQAKPTQESTYVRAGVCSNSSASDVACSISGAGSSGCSDPPSLGVSHGPLQVRHPVQTPGQEEGQLVGNGHAAGGPRAAWVDGGEKTEPDGLGLHGDRRGSYPGGPQLGAQKFATRLQSATVQYHQPLQTQHQSLPLRQLQSSPPPSQQSRLHSYCSNGASGSGSQPLQQQPQLVAHASCLQNQQQIISSLHFQSQTKASGLLFPQHQHHLQEDVPSIGQPLYQRHQQVKLGIEGTVRESVLQQPETLQLHLSQQQSQNGPFAQLQLQSQPLLSPVMPLQSQQHNSCVHGLENTVAGSLPESLQPMQILSPGCLTPTTAPTTAQLLDLQRTGNSGVGTDTFHPVGSTHHLLSASADLVNWRACSLDVDFSVSRASLVEPQLAAGSQIGSLAATGPMSVRSAELQLGRSSSDRIHDATADSSDSADLDPLDLEPMILQLLENDDDDVGSGGGSCAPLSTVAPSNTRHTPENNVRKLQVQQQPCKSQALQQQRQAGAFAARSSGHPLSSPPVTLATLQRSSLEIVPGVGFDSHNYGHHSGQQRHCQQQQLGFYTQAGVGTAVGMSGSFMASWAHIQPHTEGSPSGAAGGTAATAGSSLLSPEASQSYGASGPQGAGTGTFNVCASHNNAGTSAPFAATSDASWAMGRGDAVSAHPGAGVVGSFAGSGGVGRMNAGVLQRPGAGGVGGRAPPNGGGSGGPAGRGFGQRGPRYHGRMHTAPASYVGGRGSLQKAGSIIADRGASAAGSYRNVGGGTGGGFEAQGLVGSALPNASLLAVMQRLNT